MLAITSLKLTGLIIVLIPLILGPLVTLGRRVRRLSRTSQDRIADTSGLAGESLNAIQTVQAFTLEDAHAHRFGQAVEDSFRAAVRRTRVRAMLTAAVTALAFGGVTWVLWVGAHSVLRGEMSGGQLSQFLMYAVFVAVAAASLAEMWGEIQRAAGAMERLVELKQRLARDRGASEPRAPAGNRPRCDSLRAPVLPLPVAARDGCAGRF